MKKPLPPCGTELVRHFITTLSLSAMIPLSSPAIDLDKNGVSDVWQKAYPGTILTGEVDSDGDGLSDLKEGFFPFCCG
jgi:hypothetical protein